MLKQIVRDAVCYAVIVLTLCSHVIAADAANVTSGKRAYWPQWRGPQRDDVVGRRWFGRAKGWEMATRQS